jgi:RNA polymerase sigma factor (sigma-70 family)
MMDKLLTHQVYVQGRFLFGVAYRILRDSAAAEDACQQAFLKAWEHQHELRSHEAIRAWLTQTVIRECLAVRRRKKVENRYVESQFQPKVPKEMDETTRLEQREMVLAGVSELSEPMRTIVVLRLLEGMSGNQVKEIMQCSAVDVSRRLHEGMEVLRKKLRNLQETVGG